jgi:hypothetical protein
LRFHDHLIISPFSEINEFIFTKQDMNGITEEIQDLSWITVLSLFASCELGKSMHVALPDRVREA